MVLSGMQCAFVMRAALGVGMVEVRRPVGHAVVAEILHQFGGGVAHVDRVGRAQVVRFQHVRDFLRHHLVPATCRTEVEVSCMAVE